jgi:general stress protein 26
VFETGDELERLQALLDSSYSSASEHLTGIIHEGRKLAAREVVALLTGMKVISLATVTAAGEPRISAVDGHFLHGTWTFSTSGTSVKARHLERRPAVSIAHVDNEALAVFSHGLAQQMHEGDPDWAETLQHWTGHYGGSPLTWGPDIRLYRYQPHWMVGYAANRAALLAARGVTGHGGSR